MIDNMKHTTHCLLSGLLLFIFINGHSKLFAQSESMKPKGAIGITYSGLGDNDAFYFERLDGAGSYQGIGYHSFGITYIHPLKKNFDIETSMHYSHFSYRVSIGSLGLDAPASYTAYNSIVDIPVTVRWSFLQYFFLNGGVLLGIDVDNKDELDSQTGIGGIMGIGAKYTIKNSPFGLFLNPYLKFYNLIPFALDGHHYRMRSYEAGFRLGIVYYLP